jgi:hypothetical protein
VTDALGRVTTTNYEVLGRETSSVDALGNTATMTYLATGLQLTCVDPLGHTASMLYDSSETKRGHECMFIDATVLGSTPDKSRPTSRFHALGGPPPTLPG